MRRALAISQSAMSGRASILATIRQKRSITVGVLCRGMPGRWRVVDGWSATTFFKVLEGGPAEDQDESSFLSELAQWARQRMQ